ncbi:MAG: PEP-CTERM sorting domain-containing protein [Pirellulaceae bacterium]
MKRYTIFMLILASAFCLTTGKQAFADLILTTSTNNTADLDFDGLGGQTNGSLFVNSKSFTLLNSDLMGDPEFADITSVTITFSGPAGYNLSSWGQGIGDHGIGLTYAAESAFNGPLLSSGVGEVLNVSVSSTSSVSGKEVKLSGVGFNDWRNFFPVSEVTLSGATFDGGQNVFTGFGDAGGPIPELQFDSPVDFFAMESTGTDGFRLQDIRLSVASAVPEPGIAYGLVAGLFGFVISSRRRR